MVTEETIKLYKNYLQHKRTRWTFGNGVLYRMCEEHPYHNDAEVIAGKIMVIGRVYAAAIERRRNATEAGDDFYYDVVAPKMLEAGPELDRRLDLLRESHNSVQENAEHVISTHKFLMDIFHELTGLEKRSLASKYLHFHCPEMFFIYDSRAKAGISKIVKRPDTHILNGISNYDPEYGDYFCRMAELQSYIQEKFGRYESPRQLDSFLLTMLQ